MADRTTTLLVIGAGPYGLAMAAWAKERHVDCLVIGEPMGFWVRHMPAGMFLRSGLDWHMDPAGVHTLEAYVRARKLTRAKLKPIARDLFLSYAEWFQQKKRIDVLPGLVDRLERSRGTLAATLDSSEVVRAPYVLIAPGFKYFKHLPEEFTRMFPAQRLSHTCDLTEFHAFKGKRCLIIGGRQSAFEWAALLHEAGAASVQLSYRHATPSFEPSDWSWVPELVERTVRTPDWYRCLAQQEKEDIARHFWAEGRLKLEPWLEARITKDTISLWPRSQVVACRELSGGALNVQLDNGAALAVDHVILATGYKVNMTQIPYLAKGNLLGDLELCDGYPVLDERFESSVPGLFVCSFPATRDFGPFFGFVVGAPAAARVIGARLAVCRT